jgi:hypothetical protein
MSKLEKVTCLFLIAVCVVSIAVLVKNQFFSTNPTQSDLSGYAEKLVGQTESTVPATAWQGSQRNVVLLLSSNCHFCKESIPLYQKLSSLRRQGRFSLLAVGSEESKSLADYTHQNGVETDNVLQVRSGFAGITFTPAVFVVDSHGVIQKAFLGKLNKSDEARLLDFVARQRYAAIGMTDSGLRWSSV